MTSAASPRPRKTLRVLITGATGFVGRHLITRLEAEEKAGRRPRLQITGTCYPERSEECPDFRAAAPRVTLLPLDLRDATAVSAAVAACRPDRIFHLAAISQVRASWDQRRETIETNLMGTFHLLEAARLRAPEARLLIISSSDVYGNQPSRRMPLRETFPLNAASPYGFTKLSAEALAALYARAEKTAVVIARPFTHTGPGQSPDFVCSDWARQIAVIEAAATGKKSGRGPSRVLQVGNTSVRRDYSDVRDVVRAYTLLIEKGRPGEAYNICSGKARPLREILKMLLRDSREKIVVEVDPARVRRSDIPLLSGSHAKITRETGWRPRIPLETTLSDLLNDWRAKMIR